MTKRNIEDFARYSYCVEERRGGEKPYQTSSESRHIDGRLSVYGVGSKNAVSSVRAWLECCRLKCDLICRPFIWAVGLLSSQRPKKQSKCQYFVWTRYAALWQVVSVLVSCGKLLQQKLLSSFENNEEMYSGDIYDYDPADVAWLHETEPQDASISEMVLKGQFFSSVYSSWLFLFINCLGLLCVCE